jgi:LPS export ABC transporter protein LptC
MKNNYLILLSLFFPFLFLACSFDYGSQGSDKSLPDIVMENVEYVRVRSLDPQARLQAERVERYEDLRLMELRNLSFEQFGSGGGEVSSFGRAGRASFEIDSGDIRLDNGVRLEVEAEDIVIETNRLEWKDNDRTLSGNEADDVHIFQENGTVFVGTGFQANARTRAWEFSGGVSGVYIHDADEEEVEEVEEVESGELRVESDDGDDGENY